MPAEKPDIKHTYSLSWSYHKWGSGGFALAPEYVVVHYTGGPADTVGGVYTWWLNHSKASAHYVIDESGIYEMLDPRKYACTKACGAIRAKEHIAAWKKANPGATCQGAGMIRRAGNRNTINIEACSASPINATSNLTNVFDGNFYYPEATLKSLIKLCAWLLEEYGLPLDRLIRHHDISGKICPAMWCYSPAAYNKWAAFKQTVALAMNTPVSVERMDISDAGEAPADAADGTISVAEGTPFWSSSTAGIIVGYSKNNANMKYTIVRDNAYYTNLGWVRRN